MNKQIEGLGHQLIKELTFEIGKVIYDRWVYSQKAQRLIRVDDRYDEKIDGDPAEYVFAQQWDYLRATPSDINSNQ